MDELRFRILQTINFLVIAILSLIVQVMYGKGLIDVSPMCIPIFTLTSIIMVIIQTFNYLEKSEKGRYFAYTYFVVLCIMMYYSTSILDVVIFVINIFITFSIIVERCVYKNNSVVNNEL